MIPVEKVKESLATLCGPSYLENCDVLELMGYCTQFVEQLLDTTPIDESFAEKVRCDEAMIYNSVTRPSVWHCRVDYIAGHLTLSVAMSVTTRGQVRALFLATGRECEG